MGISMKFTAPVYKVPRLRNMALKMSATQCCFLTVSMETRKRQWEILSCLLEEREGKQGPDGGHHLDQNEIAVKMSKRSLSSSE